MRVENAGKSISYAPQANIRNISEFIGQITPFSFNFGFSNQILTFLPSLNFAISNQYTLILLKGVMLMLNLYQKCGDPVRTYRAETLAALSTTWHYYVRVLPLMHTRPHGQVE